MTNFISLLLRKFDKSPLNTIHKLGDFLGTRATYVAQTSLFGYLKTRMGSQYRNYFTNEEFAQSIRLAAITIAADATADIVIYASSCIINADKNLESEFREMNIALFEIGTTASGLTNIRNDETKAAEHYKAAFERLKNRNDILQSANNLDLATIFAASCESLSAHSPVSDDFREQDKAIVFRSMINNWKPIKKQLDSRISVVNFHQQWQSR